MGNTRSGNKRIVAYGQITCTRYRNIGDFVEIGNDCIRIPACPFNRRSFRIVDHHLRRKQGACICGILSRRVVIAYFTERGGQIKIVIIQRGEQINLHARYALFHDESALIRNVRLILRAKNFAVAVHIVQSAVVILEMVVSGKVEIFRNSYHIGYRRRNGYSNI